MDKEFKNRLVDYFDPWDLVEYLGISVEDLIDVFEDKLEEKAEAIDELMGVAND